MVHIPISSIDPRRLRSKEVPDKRPSLFDRQPNLRTIGKFSTHSGSRNIFSEVHSERLNDVEVVVGALWVKVICMAAPVRHHQNSHGVWGILRLDPLRPRSRSVRRVQIEKEGKVGGSFTVEFPVNNHQQGIATRRAAGPSTPASAYHEESFTPISGP